MTKQRAKKSGRKKADGLVKGNSHEEGGVLAINMANGKILELEGKEAVITKDAVEDPELREFDGEMLTNKEILDRINVMHGGKSLFEQEKPCVHCDDEIHELEGIPLRSTEIFPALAGGNFARGGLVPGGILKKLPKTGIPVRYYPKINRIRVFVNPHEYKDLRELHEDIFARNTSMIREGSYVSFDYSFDPESDPEIMNDKLKDLDSQLHNKGVKYIPKKGPKSGKRGAPAVDPKEKGYELDFKVGEVEVWRHPDDVTTLVRIQNADIDYPKLKRSLDEAQYISELRGLVQQDFMPEDDLKKIITDAMLTPPTEPKPEPKKEPSKPAPRRSDKMSYVDFFDALKKDPVEHIFELIDKADEFALSKFLYLLTWFQVGRKREAIDLIRKEAERDYPGKYAKIENYIASVVSIPEVYTKRGDLMVQGQTQKLAELEGIEDAITYLNDKGIAGNIMVGDLFATGQLFGWTKFYPLLAAVLLYRIEEIRSKEDYATLPDYMYADLAKFQEAYDFTEDQMLKLRQLVVRITTEMFASTPPPFPAATPVILDARIENLQLELETKGETDRAIGIMSAIEIQMQVLAKIVIEVLEKTKK